MADLGWYVFSAGGAIVCLTAAAAWTLVSHSSAASRRVLIATVLVYWIASSALVPETARRLLASGYTPVTRADVPAGRTAVVLLGSGSYRFRDWSDNEFSVVDRIGASRLLEAARVFHLLNADYIISSGGLSVVRDRNRPSGLTMAEALQGLGVPKDRILVETESKTTRHEALIIKDMLAAHPADERASKAEDVARECWCARGHVQSDYAGPMARVSPRTQLARSKEPAAISTTA